MKYFSSVAALTCITALVCCLPLTASAQSAKSASPSPAASPSPTATATESTGKPARALPFRGTVSAVDSDAKTFTIAGKTASRVFKVTDRSTVTKDGAAAAFDQIAAEGKVSGSYWKQEDGTLEVKTLKIGGAGTTEKSTRGKKSKKDASEGEQSDESAAESPSPSPKK